MKKTCFLALFVSCISICPVNGQTTDNDTIYVFPLRNHDVLSTRKWANDTAAYRYNQMKYYVTTILPYLDAATLLFNDLNIRLNDPNLRNKDRKRYIASKEAEMRSRFEDKIKDLNETQGVLLIKLIARQTGLNIYQSLRDFKGGFAAVKWQTWARINGHNINRKYDPPAEPDLERIMRSLGYPLPRFYGVQE